MERSETLNNAVPIAILFIVWSALKKVIEYSVKNYRARNYCTRLMRAIDFFIILYMLSAYLDLSEFHLGHLIYPSLVRIYNFLSNPYLYYLLCIIGFSFSYIVLEIKKLDYYQGPFSLISFILLILYLIALPTFSIYSSVPSALIPLIYFYLLYTRYYSERFKSIFQVIWTTSVFILVVYCCLRELNQERFLVFMIELLFVLGLLFTNGFILPKILSALYNKRSQRRRRSVDKNKVSYPDLEISICLSVAILLLFLAESMLEEIYSRVPPMYYIIIAYGYSCILEIAYSLYHKLRYLQKGKAFYSFLAQLAFMKSIWVCFISPILS